MATQETHFEREVECQNLAVVIAVRLDCDERLQNLRATSQYIRRYYKNAELVLVEYDSSSKAPDDVRSLCDTYVFLEGNGRFSKSYCMNSGLLKCTRPLVAFYDADILLLPDKVEWAIRTIDRHRFPVVIPHDGLFVDVKGSVRAKAIEELSIAGLAVTKPETLRRMNDVSARKVDGGVFLTLRDIALLEGGFNKKMISYGWEDLEVLLRLRKLGYYSTFADGHLVHLDHPRGPDSVPNEYFEVNGREWQNIRRMSHKALRTYTEQQLNIASGDDCDQRRELVRKRWSRSPISPACFRYFANKIENRLKLKGAA